MNKIQSTVKLYVLIICIWINTCKWVKFCFDIKWEKQNITNEFCFYLIEMNLLMKEMRSKWFCSDVPLFSNCVFAFDYYYYYFYNIWIKIRYIRTNTQSAPMILISLRIDASSFSFSFCWIDCVFAEKKNFHFSRKQMKLYKLLLERVNWTKYHWTVFPICLERNNHIAKWICLSLSYCSNTITTISTVISEHHITLSP